MSARLCTYRPRNKSMRLIRSRKSDSSPSGTPARQSGKASRMRGSGGCSGLMDGYRTAEVTGEQAHRLVDGLAEDAPRRADADGCDRDQKCVGGQLESPHSRSNFRNSGME